MKNKDFDNLFEQINLPLYGVRLPEFKIDNSYKHDLEVSEDVSNYEFLRALALKGFKKFD